MSSKQGKTSKRKTQTQEESTDYMPTPQQANEDNVEEKVEPTKFHDPSSMLYFLYI